MKSYHRLSTINLILQIKLYKINKSLMSSYYQVNLIISSLDSEEKQSPNLKFYY